MEFSLIISSFIAGLLTFLAPCTLPLVPGYLVFISGVSSDELKDPAKTSAVRRKVFFNGIFFVLGFSLVFILMGTLVGFVGAALLAPYRVWLGRIGGGLVVLFGLFMLNVLKIPFLSYERQFRIATFEERGRPLHSGVLGAAFAFGWTPCVGPVLGSVLLLASASPTVFRGALLLMVFSAGLAVPFLLIAAGIGSAARAIQGIFRYLRAISIAGGLLIIFLGILLMTGNFGFLISYSYELLRFINYEKLLEFL